MSKLNKELCVSCSKYQVLSGGDFVPYGSTIAQLPEVWGCIDDWDTSDEGEVVAVTDCEHYKKKGGGSMELNKELLKTYREDVLLEVQEEMERVFGSAPDIIDKIVDALLKMHHKEG